MKHLQLYSQYNINEQTDPNEEESLGSALVRGLSAIPEFLSKNLNPFGDDTIEQKYEDEYLKVAPKYKGTGKFPPGWKLTSKTWTPEIGKYFNIPKPSGKYYETWVNPKDGQKGIWVSSIGGGPSIEEIGEDIHTYLLPDFWNNWVKQHDIIGPMIEQIFAAAVAPEFMMAIWVQEGINQLLPVPGKKWTIVDIIGGVSTIYFSVSSMKFLQNWLKKLKNVTVASYNRLISFFEWLKSKFGKTKGGLSSLFGEIKKNWSDVLEMLETIFTKENWTKFLNECKVYIKSTMPSNKKVATKTK